jgi:hypothetical protein
VDRQPLLRVKQSIPSRVALKQVNGQFSITSNNIDGLLDIHGNDAIFNAVLADPQNPATYTSIGLTGIITDQNYVISDSNYGVGTVKMVQSITKKRNIISIPFGTNDPAIVEVSLPVESIYVPPTIVPPVTPPRRPNPIPPPTPPTIIIIPPELKPDLIWFNIYVQPYDLPNACSNKKHIIFQAYNFETEKWENNGISERGNLDATKKREILINLIKKAEPDYQAPEFIVPTKPISKIIIFIVILIVSFLFFTWLFN